MKRRGGFALVSALLLIVVLSVLGGYLVRIVAVQHATPALRVQAVRADYAARSAMAWAVREATQDGNCPASVTFALDGAALAGFSANVRCARSDHTLGDETRPYWIIDVTASQGVYGSADFVARSLQAKVGGS